MRLERSLGLGSICLFALSCGTDPGSPRGTQSVDEDAAPLVQDESAKRLVDSIRGSNPSAAPSRAVAARLPTSAKAPVARYRRTPNGIAAELVSEDAAAAVLRSFPARASDALHLALRDSAVAVSARLLGANQGAEARVAEDYLVYPDALTDGSTMLLRATSDGFEDYVAFDRAPENAEVRYSIELSDAVAGLRLVSDTLEFLDAESVPRLRVAPPYLVDASGTEHHATLSVEGCAVDADPSAPWGRPTVAPGARECELSVRWDDANVRYPAVLDPAWSSTGNLISARAHHVAAVLPNGRVLVAGGSNAAGNAALRSAELFDPQTKTWAATGQLVTGRAQATATVRNNGSVVVTGGWNLSSTLRSVESYNPTTGAWSTLASMVTARRQHTATLLQNGEILVTGGRTTTTPIAAAETLSTANAWSAAGNMPVAQEGHTATLLSTGRVLVVGANAPTAALYNPATRSFASTAGAPEPRKFHTASLLPGGSVLLAGGTSKSAQVYEPTANVWQRVGSTSASHSVHTAHRLNSGRIALVGGAQTNSRTALEVYNPTWGTWSPGTPVVTARSAHAGATLNDGKLLIAGGIPAGSATATASAELYDPSGAETATAEYRFPASVDADVLGDRSTEVWASLHRPAALVTGRRYPLLVFLHGNHATCGTGSNPRVDDQCTYTETGTCPAGYSVVNNHRGYDYVADDLAARGYFVVSVNANRGITCGGAAPGDGGLNLARGRLILKHMQRLSAWNRGIETTPATLGVSLRDRIDFNQVGLMGHSRGGEGVRAAYNLYRDAGSPWPSRIGSVSFRGIFEIGPVDGQTERVLNAEQTRWNVLLPACDNDVAMEGIKPFERMLRIPEPAPAFKSTYHVWGANHNYYNTEWQVSDSPGCFNHRALFNVGEGVSGSAEQRQTGLFSMVSFFTANVGPSPDAAWNSVFDPQFPFAPESPVYRGYHPGGDAAYSLVLEDFINPTGTSSYGLLNDQSGVTVEHAPVPVHADAPAARIDWTTPSPSTYFQSNFAPGGSGFDLRSYAFLDLRVDRPYMGEEAVNPQFTVQLVNANGSLSSAVPISDFVVIANPPRFMSLFQTVRIPLTRFTAATLASVRAVRLTFGNTANGVLYLANVRATRSTASGSVPLGSAALASASAAPAAAAGPIRSLGTTRVVSTGNVVTALESVGADSVRLSLSSAEAFTPRGELLTLSVGTERTVQSAHPGGNLRTVRFTLPRAAFDRLKGGERISVSYGSSDALRWDFGTLDKTALDR